MIRNGWTAVASSACSGETPRPTTRDPSWKPRYIADAVERERSGEEGVEAGVDRAPRGGSPAQQRSEVEERAGSQHRQAGDEVDVRVGDRVDPLACMSGPEEPVRVRRLDLDHALDGADGQAQGAGGEELPEVAVRLGHVHESPLEDGEEHGRREAPVADPHHACPHADRGSVPVAHARLCGLILPAVSHAHADCDPVGDERDVEDREPAGREPEGSLREAVARERAPDDPREHVPAEPRCDQGPPSDDHQVRVGEVADEMACVPGTRQPFGGPRQVLQDHVHAAEHEEEPAGQEVLGELAVVTSELLVGVRLRPDRRLLPGHDDEDRGHDDREERRVAQELERGEVLDPHGPGSGPSGAPARRSRRSASTRGRG